MAAKADLVGKRALELEEAGAQARIVSPSQGKVKGWNHTEWGDELPVDVPLARTA